MTLPFRPGLTVLAMALIAPIAAGDAGAAPKTFGTPVPLKPGTTVTGLGNGTFSVGGPLGERGTFSCSCTGGSGSCNISRQSGGLVCGVVGDSCKGHCKLTTTSSGLGLSPF
jgi:hypothetical protein